jgi:hypothetical protein
MAALLAAEPHADVLHELVPREPLAQRECRHFGKVPALLAGHADRRPDPEVGDAAM